MTDASPSSAPRVGVILLAGGVGARAGFARPKQLEPLGSKPGLRWSLDAFAAHPAISVGVLVADDAVAAPVGALPSGWRSAAPGAEGQQSVANGLTAFASGNDAELVLVHDSARPGVRAARSDEHTFELQSLLRISYAVFCC